jgi:hypothetical protein
MFAQLQNKREIRGIFLNYFPVSEQISPYSHTYKWAHITLSQLWPQIVDAQKIGKISEK